jgi:hypothetical protein
MNFAEQTVKHSDFVTTVSVMIAKLFLCVEVISLGHEVVLHCRVWENTVWCRQLPNDKSGAEKKNWIYLVYAILRPE